MAALLSALRGLRLARAMLNVAVGLLIVVLLFPFSSLQRRQQWISWWARGLLRIFRIDLQVVGAPAPGGVMLLINHISWLDIYVINGVCATRFVAKSEIRRWPVFGFLAARTGTLFLERGRRRAVHDAIRQLTESLQANDRVGVFPEGTTGDGSSLLPFHANLVQAALNAPVLVQPVALSYRTVSGTPTTAAAFVGEMNLFESQMNILRAAPLTAHLEFLAPIVTAGRSRHDVADEARRAIAVSLGFGNPDSQPETALGREDELL